MARFSGAKWVRDGCVKSFIKAISARSVAFNHILHTNSTATKRIPKQLQNKP